MPTEIVLTIVEYLDPITRGALALTSRALFIKSGGNDAFKFDHDDAQASQRHGLLLRLAKDKRYLPLTLCPFCSIFHRPISATLPAGVTFNPEDARSANSKLQKCQRESPILNPSDYAAMAEYLPAKVHQSIIKAILESYATVGSAADVAQLRELPLETDSHEAEIGEGENGAITLFCFNYDLAINNDGRILLKTQKSIIPCWRKTTSDENMSGEEVVAAVESLGQILSYPPLKPPCHKLLNQICEHMGDDLTTRHLTLFGRSSDRPRFECMWTHPISSTNCCPKSIEKSACITKCKDCYTDLGVHMRDLEIPGKDGFQTRKARAAVLTTWCDLGSRLPSSSWERRKTGSNHIPEPGGTDSTPSEQRSCTQPPTVLLQFEGGGNTPRQERYQIPGLRYFNFGFRWPANHEFRDSGERGSSGHGSSEGTINNRITSVRAEEHWGVSIYYLPMIFDIVASVVKTHLGN